MRTCDIDGCSNAHRAKGLCVTHYNAINRKPNPTSEYTCPMCGDSFVKETARANRYKNVYCSILCRDYAQSSAAFSSQLPQFHMARWAGQHSIWAPPIMARRYQCEWCGADAETKITAQRFCTQRCKIKSGKANRRAKEYSAEGTYRWADIVRLWLGFGKQCAYCHTPTNLPDIQAEHVHPLARGGRNDLSNLLPSCGPCNADKRDLPLLDWNADRARRNLPPVTTTWSHADNRYSHLATVTPLVTEPPLAA